MSTGVALAVDPPLGGALVEIAGWRTVFWVTAPLAVAGAVLVGFIVPRAAPAEPRRFDIPGQLLITGSVAVLVTSLIEGDRWGPWPWQVAGCLLSACVFVAFVAVESRVRNPVIDAAFLKQPSFSAAVLTAIVTFARYGESFS